MNQSDVDGSWQEYWSSNGTFIPDQLRAGPDAERLDLEKEICDRLATVYKGQNRLLRMVANAVDAAWPPQEYTENGMSPGGIVRQFIINIAEAEGEQG